MVLNTEFCTGCDDASYAFPSGTNGVFSFQNVVKLMLICCELSVCVCVTGSLQQWMNQVNRQLATRVTIQLIGTYVFSVKTIRLSNYNVLPTAKGKVGLVGQHLPTTWIACRNAIPFHFHLSCLAQLCRRRNQLRRKAKDKVDKQTFVYLVLRFPSTLICCTCWVCGASITCNKKAKDTLLSCCM